MKKLIQTLSRAATALLVAGALIPAAAQQATGIPAGQMAQQSLRPYWHVFVAYAIAILMVMLWAGSIGKRLSDIESRLGE